ncbi:DUF808 domain-containing protein [Pseudoalteromonas sp. SSM20]|uniref:DUF808 domain-containing protein n=1 Tax=Pseudoalteromonas sp. SSM20 TaxID=3139394 RepID=UPI003BAB17F1
MAGASLLTLIDDIATLLDDIAVMSKVAAKKTAGVLGDDLALNAQQVSGVKADRELPVVWAVAKGSFVNKLILVPLALLISAFAPFLVTPLLMLGGLFLCFEGCEKVLGPWLHGKHAEDKDSQLDIHDKHYEQQKIKGAIRTDFILSAEIIVISLGTVANESFTSQLSVLSVIAVLMTIGVYGLVALIVKIDDAGLLLLEQPHAWQQKIGRGLLSFAPYLMKLLAIVGTLAMFLVGGGILVHGSSFLHHSIEQLVETINLTLNADLSFFLPTLFNAIIGFVAGAVIVAATLLLSKFRNN